MFPPGNPGSREAFLPSNPPPLNAQPQAALNTLISTLPVLPPHLPALDGDGGPDGLRQQLPRPLPLCSTHRRPWCEGRRRGKAGYLFPNPSCPVTVSWSHPPTAPKHGSISQSSGKS